MTASLAARRSQRTGSDFELVVCARLRLFGCAEVEQVATPMAKVRGMWVRGRKVSCDVKAVLPPSGRAVHVECKLRVAGTLTWSDLEEHQHRRLGNAMRAGALAVIAFSDARSGIELVDYAKLLAQGWEPRSQLTEEARSWAAVTAWPNDERGRPMK